MAGSVVIVCCSRGGCFQTVWVPFVSFRSVRLGRYRLQRCPVHGKVEFIHRVDPATLTPEQQAQAAQYPSTSRLP